ncbi:MAG TPA: formylglycine-generating enzyme family protein [Steroidobacteraceae bacterium]|nr:formylglycine-generating enzyme family protein [Steroidobacteraceae bacterium]HQX77496.1 formylglycine-generating enzyme family protein [Steroidobacteraceae bacterium]
MSDSIRYYLLSAGALLVLSFASGVGGAAAHVAESEFRDCEDCPTMVVVNGGSFRMGSLEGEEGRSEGPIHDVTIGYSFAVGKFEVTNGQFARFAKETGYKQEKNCIIWTGKWEALPDSSWRNPGYGRAPTENEPVGCVSWHDAKAYIAWLSRVTSKAYRLPTEAEWEYFARAGSSTRFPWGDDADDICKRVNLFDVAGEKASELSYTPAKCDDGYPFTAPVGSFPPNAFGLHDVIGNVWEWVEDCYIVPYPPGYSDGRSFQVGGQCERRSIRGGSWITTPSRQRPAFRGRDPAEVVFVPFGFRVVRDLDPGRD